MKLKVYKVTEVCTVDLEALGHKSHGSGFPHFEDNERVIKAVYDEEVVWKESPAKYLVVHPDDEFTELDVPGLSQA